MPGPQQQPSFADQLAIAQQQMQQEMPAQMSAASLTPMTPATQALYTLGARLKGSGTPYMSTDPRSGSIYYNAPAMAGQSQEDVNNTLAHELTHVRQGQQEAQQPWYVRAAQGLRGALPVAFGGYQYPIQPGQQPPQNYQPDPRELEAFQTEADRTLSRQLPSPYDKTLYSDTPKTPPQFWKPRP